VAAVAVSIKLLDVVGRDAALWLSALVPPPVSTARNKNSEYKLGTNAFSCFISHSWAFNASLRRTEKCSAVGRRDVSWRICEGEGREEGTGISKKAGFR
jgi:hypothetical protein